MSQPHQPVHINDQTNTAVRHDGSAGDSLGAVQIISEALDHNLLLPEQAVRKEPHLPPRIFHQHHNPLQRIRNRIGDLEKVPQTKKRDQPPLDRDHLAPVRHRNNILRPRTQGADNREGRDNISLAAGHNDHPINNREAERQADTDESSLARRGHQLDSPAQTFHVLLHHVHAHAAARDLGDLVRRREPRLKNYVEQFVIVHRHVTVD